MKVLVKMLVGATMVVLFVLAPFWADAACNDANGNNVTMTIQGPLYLGVNATKSHTLNANSTPSTYSWTASDLTFTLKRNHS